MCNDNLLWGVCIYEHQVKYCNITTYCYTVKVILQIVICPHTFNHGWKVPMFSSSSS